MDATYRFSSRVGADTHDNRIALLARELKATGIPVLNLAESNPTRCGLVYPGTLDALGEPASLAYEPDSRGLLVARTALSRRLGCSPQELFLSASTSEAYAWLFKLLCEPGEAVLVPKPGYPLFDYLAGLEGVRAEPYRLEYSHPHGWRIDIDELAERAGRCGARAVVVINPNNPTGSYLAREERERLVALCAERGLTIISDEVFLPYALEADGTQASLGGEDRCLCFTLDGLSKLMCLPQLKLGWMRVSGPPDAVGQAQSRLEVIADTYLSAGAPVMNALPSLLPGADAFVSSVRARLARNLAVLKARFGAPDSPWRVLRCDGGWTAILECPRLCPDEDLVLGLLRAEAVMAHPGYFFDFERDGCLALSLILEPGRFDEGLCRLKRYLDSLL